MEQQSNHTLQREVLLLQKQRMLKQDEMAEVELQKARELAAIEVTNAKEEQEKRQELDAIEKDKQREAASIEINRLKRLAELDILAKEEEIKRKNN